jgi:hypothetical protein
MVFDRLAARSPSNPAGYEYCPFSDGKGKSPTKEFFAGPMWKLNRNL